jgi:hypothetical protein
MEYEAIKTKMWNGSQNICQMQNKLTKKDGASVQ